MDQQNDKTKTLIFIGMHYQYEKFTIKMPAVISEDRSGLIKVDDHSPIGHRKAAEIVATFFRRELQYGFVQYNSLEPSGGIHEPYVPTIAYLFTHPKLVHYTKLDKRKVLTIGACCFRERLFGTASNPIWVLDWVWMHPYERSKGLLSKYWEVFVNEFGIFPIQPPISKGMERFLAKQGHNPIIPYSSFN